LSSISAHSLSGSNNTIPGTRLLKTIIPFAFELGKHNSIIHTTNAQNVNQL